MVKTKDLLKDLDFQKGFKNMLTMSEILIEQYKIQSYKELKEYILKKIEEGEMFLSLDIKPSFDDTPEYWETDLENLFTSPRK
tara:strand:- start:1016 stop:1264 length:249 start_codon:yes stop_codon:yes gene_type:complete